MKRVIIIISVSLAVFASRVSAQFVTIDPAHIAASIVNAANQIVQTSSTVTNVVKNFQEVQKVYNQGKEYYDALKSVNNLIKDAQKVRDAILLVGEIGDIYVNSYQKMLNDPHFTFEELLAISNGYTMLLDDAAKMILEIKDVVNINGLSMNDNERMAIIDKVYWRLRQHRNLVAYYTRKNISVSYLRAKKANDTDRVIALYGNSDDRYW
jgi:ppGpp synthetase/RelA/SpoT-type nucleotidyltranferase